MDSVLRLRRINNILQEHIESLEPSTSQFRKWAMRVGEWERGNSIGNVTVRAGLSLLRGTLELENTTYDENVEKLLLFYADLHHTLCGRAVDAHDPFMRSVFSAVQHKSWIDVSPDVAILFGEKEREVAEVVLEVLYHKTLDGLPSAYPKSPSLVISRVITMSCDVVEQLHGIPRGLVEVLLEEELDDILTA